MLRRRCGTIGTWTLIVLLAASALGEQGTSLLKPGDALPPLAGQTVAGKSLNLPTAAEGKIAVVIFSFSRAGGRDAQKWAQHLSKDDPHLPIYTAIFLESVPRLFRSIAVSGIRSGMPPVMLDQTLLLYQQQASWEQRLHVTDENHACVLVLGRAGHLRWVSPGPFEESVYARVKEEVVRP
jgi:ATP synthase subunit 10